jgi:predicted Na+-dependent transporter
MPLPIAGLIPEWALTLVAVATIFTLMFQLGISVAPGEYRSAWRAPGLMARGLFASLVAVPVVVFVVARAFGLPRAAEIGLVLMAISPGAPVALRRALDAGADRAFGPALQVAVAVLATVSMPLSVAAFDEVYAGSASVAPWHLARQVFLAQLLPLGLGMASRHHFGPRLAPLEPVLERLTAALLMLFVALVLVDVWHTVLGAGGRVMLAAAVASLLCLGTGHLLGGPAPATRTALAVSCAARNAGLAMLVASLNDAPPAVMATLLAYLFVSAVAVTPYVAWRRRSAHAAPGGDAALQKTSLP